MRRCLLVGVLAVVCCAFARPASASPGDALHKLAVALLLGPLVGTLLLFATNASFDVVNLTSDLVYVVSLPFAAIATTYLYFDLLSRREAAPA